MSITDARRNPFIRGCSFPEDKVGDGPESDYDRPRLDRKEIEPPPTVTDQGGNTFAVSVYATGRVTVWRYMGSSWIAQ